MKSQLKMHTLRHYTVVHMLLCIISCNILWGV